MSKDKPTLALRAKLAAFGERKLRSGRAKENGPALLAALERLLKFPQNQDSTDPKQFAAIRHARLLVSRLREPPKA